MVVVLAARVGPRKPKHPPTGISSSIPSTATVVWKRFSRPRASTASIRSMLEAAQQRKQLRRGVDDDVCGVDELAGRLVRRDGHANADLEAVERAEAVEIGRVVTRVERPSQPGFFGRLRSRGPL